MIRKRMFMAAVLGAVSGLLMAAPLNIGPASKSTLTATFKQEGVAVESSFKSFKGVIDFDPKNVAGASALIDVDMASLDLGDPAYSEELRKKSWFDSAGFPRGVFKSTTIKAVNATRFDATGTLTVKGRVLTITVPVAISTSPAGPVFDGNFVMSRKAFGIGDPIWEDAVDDKVTVKFHLVGGK
ncbi:MAG: YceI family protein [Steroidobacteraceae bacterium]